MHALIRLDTANYGYICSRHRTSEAAKKALARKESAVLRRHSNAITRLMYRTSEIEDTARTGDRVRIEVAA